MADQGYQFRLAEGQRALENAAAAKDLVQKLVPLVGKRNQSCTAGCHHALDVAIITAPDARDPVMASRLQSVAGRVLG